jgi:hypothetical protein
MNDAARWAIAFLAFAIDIVALRPHSGWTPGARGTVVFVAMVVIVVALAPLDARRRTRAMQAAAGTIGFTFQGDDWIYPTPSPQLGTTLFTRAGGRVANVMTGTAEGLNTSLFDCSCPSRSSGTGGFSQTVGAFSQELWLPLFEVRPVGASDPIRRVWGDVQIDFDFKERYVLRGTDEDKLRELFTPALTSALDSFTPEEHWHIEGMGTTLILYRAGVMVRTEDLPAFLQQTSLIARTFFSLCGLKKPLETK